jgi:hypothetical protein
MFSLSAWLEESNSDASSVLLKPLQEPVNPKPNLKKESGP